MSTVSFSSLKLFNVNALLTFHNIHINFKPGRIITNNPFLFPTHERWIPLFCWRRQANCIFLLNHCRVFFIASGEYRFPSYNHTHTARTVYEQTSLLTIGFFLNISPEKHVTQITKIIQFHVFQIRNSERKPFKKTQDNRGDFLTLSKTLVGPIPPTPYVPYVIGSKKLWDLRFKTVMTP